MMNLKKFFETPGYCTLKELQEIKEYFLRFNRDLNIFADATSIRPFGYMIDSHLDKVDYYINYVIKHKKSC